MLIGLDVSHVTETSHFAGSPLLLQLSHSLITSFLISSSFLVQFSICVWLWLLDGLMSVEEHVALKYQPEHPFTPYCSIVLHKWNKSHRDWEPKSQSVPL